MIELSVSNIAEILFGHKLRSDQEALEALCLSSEMAEGGERYHRLEENGCTAEPWSTSDKVGH